MDLAEACFHLRHRRAMYLMDDRYETVVAFITGLAAASDGQALAGFGERVADHVLGHSSPRVWWSVLRDGDGTTDPLSDEAATEKLLDLLESFAERSR